MDSSLWLQQHQQAVANPKSGFEAALLKILNGATEYCQAHQERYDSVIGEDGVIGDAMQEILWAFGTLLSGERGRLDGNSLDRAWRQLAREHGLKAEE